MLPPLEPYTVVLFSWGAHAADPLDDAGLDALQAAHLAYIRGLIDQDKVRVAGPLSGGDGKLRGIAVFRTSVEEAIAITEQDPAVRVGRLAFDALTWWPERGRLDTV